MTGDALTVDGPRDLPADIEEVRITGEQWGGRDTCIHLFEDCGYLTAASEVMEWSWNNTPTGYICRYCANRHPDLPDGCGPGAPAEAGTIDRGDFLTRQTYEGGWERLTLTNCPFCGKPFDRNEHRWKHFENDHNPEDAGLSPLGTVPDTGPLFLPVDELPGAEPSTSTPADD